MHLSSPADAALPVFGHVRSHSTSAHLMGESRDVPPDGSLQFPTLAGADTLSVPNQRWQTRRMSRSSTDRVRRRSRAETFTMHTQEAVKVVAPPISLRLVVLCVLWYLSSAVSSNLSKSILQIFSYPVSLTMIQFVYAALFSSALVLLATRQSAVAHSFPKGTVSTTGLVGPEPIVLQCTAPMACFQIVGHIFSNSATSKIPVSLVHAIKSLSPLLTVTVYALIFRVKYNMSTYIALIPLTLGVIMACSAEFRASPLPLFYAFMSCVVFVSQNIWSKKLLTTGSYSSSTGAERQLDKVSIILWCAIVGFAGTLPIWLLSDGYRGLRTGFSLQSGGTYSRLLILTALNGFSHFCQNLLSFTILGSVSTVSYSIASLLKRVFVMSAAIAWFGQRVSSTQGYGIALTFVGLYIYDRFGTKKESGEDDKMVLPK